MSALPCLDHGLSGNKPGGYHQRRVGGKLYYVHRLAYAKAHGISVCAVPALLRHTCDNPRCIEPTHLLPGTHLDNARDRVTRGRSAKFNLAKRVLTPAQAQEVALRHSERTGKYCKFNGVMALAKEFNVSTQAIYGAIRRAAHSHT